MVTYNTLYAFLERASKFKETDGLYAGIMRFGTNGFSLSLTNDLENETGEFLAKIIYHIKNTECKKTSNMRWTKQNSELLKMVINGTAKEGKILTQLFEDEVVLKINREGMVIPEKQGDSMHSMPEVYTKGEQYINDMLGMEGKEYNTL